MNEDDVIDEINDLQRQLEELAAERDGPRESRGEIIDAVVKYLKSDDTDPMKSLYRQELIALLKKQGADLGNLV